MQRFRSQTRKDVRDTLRAALTNAVAEELIARAGHELRHRETKTVSSTAILPVPDICITALKLRQDRQQADRERAADAWQGNDLVFTSTYGTPYEPRNFNRQFAGRCRKAEVRYTRVHDTRRTCASLLVALDVHPRVAMQILRHSQIAMTMEVHSEVPRPKPAVLSSGWESS